MKRSMVVENIPRNIGLILIILSIVIVIVQIIFLFRNKKNPESFNSCFFVVLQGILLTFLCFALYVIYRVDSTIELPHIKNSEKYRNPNDMDVENSWHGLTGTGLGWE